MGVFATFSGGKIFSGFPGFSASTQRGTRTAAGVFALSGRGVFRTDPAGHSNCRRRVRPFRAGSFPLNLSVGIRRLRTAGTSRRPPRGAKRKDNLRFYFLFEILPFPCFLIWRRLPTCDRFENRERQSGYLSVCFATYSQFTDSVLLHIWATLRRRGITVSRLLEVADLCSSTVSDTANRLLKRTNSEGSSSAAEKNSSAVPLFRSGHMSVICARLSKGKG